MSTPSTLRTLLGPPSSASSKTTEKRSWNATKSLERMLQGRMRPELLPTSSPMTFERILADTYLDPTGTPASERSQASLYEALIGDPRELLSDYVERPTSYPYELLPILLLLVNQSKTYKELTDPEREILNQATMIYAERSKPSKPSSPEPPARSTLQDPDDEGLEDEEVPWVPQDGAEISLEDFPETPYMPANWWKNSF